MAHPGYPPSFVGYLVDSNALGIVADLLAVRELPVFVTHLQRDDVEEWENPLQRERLRRLVVVLPSVPTSEAVWGVSAWDEACFGQENDDLYRIRDAIEALDRQSGKPSSDVNLMRDALIVSTALGGGYCLVTNDENMRKVAGQWQVQTIRGATLRKRYRE